MATKEELQIQLDAANTKIGILEEKLEAVEGKLIASVTVDGAELQELVGEARAELIAQFQEGIDALTTEIVELKEQNDTLRNQLRSAGVKVYVAPEPEPEVKLCKGLHSYWPIEDFEEGSDYCKEYLNRVPLPSEAVVVPKSKKDVDRVSGAQPGIFPKGFVRQI